MEEETEALDFCDFPYVVKPCDCNSSKGVQKVENLQELKQAINKAFSLSRSKRVIVERFLDGVEIHGRHMDQILYHRFYLLHRQKKWAATRIYLQYIRVVIQYR